MTALDATFLVMLLILLGIFWTYRGEEPGSNSEDSPDESANQGAVPSHWDLDQIAGRFRRGGTSQVEVADRTGKTVGVIDSSAVKWALSAGLPTGLIVAQDLAVPAGATS